MMGVDDPAAAPPKVATEAGPEAATIEEGVSKNFDEDEEVARNLDWRRQITVRGVLVGIVVGFAMTIISLKLSLTTGVIPSLNICAGLLGFIGIRTGTRVLGRWLSDKYEFTKQENTVVQTLAVAQYSTAFILGFGSYYIAMDKNSWIATGSIESQASQVAEITYGNTIPFALLICFTGIFTLNALRKNFVVDLNLTYPSGTATAVMINGFFADNGRLAHQQFATFGRWFCVGFFKDFFDWFFQGDGSCGLATWPTFGMKAYDWSWSFDWSINYIGVGMLCGHSVNYSMMVGAIIGWGIMWPIFEGKAGDWYPEDAGSNLNGLLGYKVFLAIALIVGDGIYNIIKMAIISYQTYREHQQNKNKVHIEYANEADEMEMRMRHRVFMSDSFPHWVTWGGYIVCLVLGCICIPFLYEGTHWFVLLVAYLMIPFFAPANAYICGLTDWDMSSTFGKLAIFVFAIWSYTYDPNTGILAGLATCGVVLAGTSQAAVLMQDYKTGFITRSSPKAMFFAQLLGTFVGCFLSPAAFFIFYNAFDVGDPDGPYPAPYGEIYRAMAILGTEGFGALPTHCPAIMLGFFLAAWVMNLTRDLAPRFMSESKAQILQNIIPIPGVMSIPFYISASLAIDMCLGSLVNFIWKRYYTETFSDFYIAVASGLIAGDGLWSLPSAILALAGVSSPICMSFSKTAA
ncbi:Metal-nicotianamine transporter YSL2 [Hondaea fermentalgiana]|uniref:Metal-nicotianamine transporter YSL2 n=1 Tax=Hondaea fermentalgiana TaxID=2315210 RepID=A0A2R5GQF2_9STRA|nr:Metal-nicotianamine transporter YSL2 [Hondaea fermentalgiana]|eukprot:GBG33106.1 Metal-nicotianamine transporter YSL2 [Hondaea fermentalgiana]